MSPRETDLMVDVLASTIPDAIDLSDERAVTQHLTKEIGHLHGYRLAIVGNHIPEITRLAREKRMERAMA